MFGDVDDSTRHFFHYMPKTVGFIFGHLSCCRLPKIPNKIGQLDMYIVDKSRNNLFRSDWYFKIKCIVYL